MFNMFKCNHLIEKFAKISKDAPYHVLRPFFVEHSYGEGIQVSAPVPRSTVPGCHQVC